MKFVSYTIARADTGAVLPYAHVTVYQSDGTTVATIYNAGGSTISNPVTADGTGTIGFAAPNATYVLKGASADGTYTVPNIIVDIFDLNALANALASATVAGMVTKVKTTKALLLADLAATDGQLGLVYADTTATNNDIYVKSGASGSGSWSSTGLFSGVAAAYATAAATSATAAAASAATAAAAVPAAPGSATVIPVVVDSAGQRLLEIVGGRLEAAGGLSATMRQTVFNQLSADGLVISKAQSQSRGQRTAYTDGRTLSKYRGKRALIQAGKAGILTMAVMGHSWFDYLPLPYAIATAMYSNLGLTSPSAGVGFIPAFQQTFCQELTRVVTRTSSGTWTQNGSPGGYINPPAQQSAYGSGPDGRVVSTTGTGYYQWAAVEGNKVVVYYWDGNGTFKVNIDGTDTTPDGGSGATITCGNTGTHKKATFTLGGSGTATHTIKVDCTGNTGTVALHGLIATNTAITSGLLFHKIGVSGARMLEYSYYTSSAGRTWWKGELNLDLQIVAGIINDYSQRTSPEDYMQGLTDLLSVGNGGKIVVCEPQCGVSAPMAAYPQSVYRDANIAVALSQGVEWCNMFDSWDTYANETAFWDTTGHINASSFAGGTSTSDVNGSAKRFTNELTSNFLFK